MTWPYSSSLTSTSWTVPWDLGIEWGTIRTIEPTELPLEVAYLRDQVVKAAGGNVEDTHLELLAMAATYACEHDTREQLMAQGWEQRMSGFPSGDIVLQRNPVLSVDGIDYVDADGVIQTLAVSPAEFQFVAATIGRKARVRPNTGESWPAAISQPDAVTVRFTAGYESVAQIPPVYLNGICVWVVETYKQRGFSVQNTIQNVPAVLSPERFWKPRYRGD